MYTGLTKDVCERALEVVEPAILAASARGIIKRDHGCLVVLDPKIPYEPKYKTAGPLFEKDVVIFEHQYEGAGSESWEHPYDLIALSKAFISWKTGLPSRQVLMEAPHLYEVDMTKFGGSAVENGLVVAFSGVEEYFDQMISEMMLAAIKGVCLHEMFKPDGVMADVDIDFIGG